MGEREVKMRGMMEEVRSDSALVLVDRNCGRSPLVLKLFVVV